MTPHPISEGLHPLFTPAECADLTERLLDLQAFWLPRHSHFPFFTLGATNYYDITANPARPYDRLARQYNPFLLENFPEVYARLLTVLREHLQQPVEYCAGTALPGFHIFAAHSSFAERPAHDILHGQWFAKRDGVAFPGNPIHVDTVHLALGLSDHPEGSSPAETLSFTLAVCLPQNGAGMKIWPLADGDMRYLPEQERLDVLQRTESRQVTYRPGSLFVHSGNFYHQARGLPVQGEEYRMTLQGHGLWKEGRWQLFW